MPRKKRLPALPALLGRKIYKSGQTRGADDDEIYQNRVSRMSTVLIPYHFWGEALKERIRDGFFKCGYIVLIKPEEYFARANPDRELAEEGLALGRNCLVFYETRAQWSAYDPDQRGWSAADSRTDPLGGQYVARVPATTAAQNSDGINRGFMAKKMKGAGIRLYEYTDEETINKCRIQLEAVYWLCYDSIEAAVAFGMSRADAESRRQAILASAAAEGLLEYEALRNARIIDEQNRTVCPLCLKPLSARGFYTRMAQAEGREVPDLTVTEINLFHIEELRYGCYNHRPYNLGWGHHHCNVVVKDAGILPTLCWMKQVVLRNEAHGTVVEPGPEATM